VFQRSNKFLACSASSIAHCEEGVFANTDVEIQSSAITAVIFFISCLPWAVD
jgi:hypothetical protein